MTTSDICHRLEQHVTIARRRFLLRYIANTSPWVVLLAATICLAVQSWLIGAFTLVLGLLVAVVRGNRSQAYQQITLANLLLHLNRTFDALEESAQLITRPLDSLNILQQLQRARIGPVLRKHLDDNSVAVIPVYSFMQVLISTVVVAIILSLLWLSHHQRWIDWTTLISTEVMPASIDSTRNEETNGAELSPPAIESVEIQVTPPTYTQQSAFTTDDMNLTVLAGSTVSWRIGFSDARADYQLNFSEDVLNMEKVDKTFHQASTVVTKTGVYSISDSVGSMKSLYSITATADGTPYVRFITPKVTITEVPKSGEPLIAVEALVGDDFGVSKVDILASIAKGSGEAVKFRDEVFQFDESRPSNNDAIYSKTWYLTDLGMEPGDEFYFSIRVWDNKAPEEQMTQSQTKIVRWLEDEQEGVLSNGVVIDFVPEYFKSQRQIIIETQELISSEDQLSRDEFKRTSQSLGQSQSDLKQKYGQFLGDEFGEGGADVVSEEDNFEIHDHNDEEHEEADHEEGEHQEKGHQDEEHEHEFVSNNDDLSDYEKIVAQYGHAHGQVDIGLITKQNPKAMMKRAIAAMWQAELHLLLSEPELALPFENEALAFLNKAKKAERIYVKRLGFEPPPVTEERRYQGDLDDIDNRQRLIIDEVDRSATGNITQILGLLERHRTDLHHTIINEEEKGLVREVIALLLDNTGTEPELIRHVTTLERVILNRSFDLEACGDCLTALEQRLWGFVSSGEAVPATSDPSNTETKLTDHYLELIGVSDDTQGNALNE